MPHQSPGTRQVILDAASRLFAQRTFDSVKMEDIAKEAKIGKPTLYRYFETKDDLYFTLLEGVGKDFLDVVRKAEAAVRGCRPRLIAIVRASMGYFQTRPYLLKLLDRAGLDDREKDFPWLEVQQQLFRMLQGLLAEGVFRSEFGVDDLEVAVRAVIGAMRFQLLYPCAEVTPEQIPERIVELVLRPAARAAAAA
jgi:AcrR family transcriptional regulator